MIGREYFKEVSIETKTIVKTIENGCDQGCDFNSQPWNDFDDQVSTRVATRVAIRVAIATLNRNPETTWFRFFLKIATLAIFYGFDYGFGFDRNLLKVFPVYRVIPHNFVHFVKT